MEEHSTRTAPAGDLPEGKTAKQIADELGIDKSTVFRYCRSALLQPVATTPGRNGAKYYDATAEKAIKDHFEQSRARLAAGRTIARNSAEDSAHQCGAPPADAAPVQHLRQQLEDVTADRDRLRDQLRQIQADHAGQLERMQGAFVGELTALTDRLNTEHRQQLDRIQAGHAAELDRLREDHRHQLDDLRAQLDQLRRDLTEERQHGRDTAERLAQLADQAQRLQLAQMQPPAALPEDLTERPQDQNRPSFWQRIFGKK